MQAQRVAYVIDYSASMKGQGREKLMRNELTKSVEKLTAGMSVPVDFLRRTGVGGGRQVKMRGARKRRRVEHRRHEFKWKCDRLGAHGFGSRTGKKQVPDWIEVGGLGAEQVAKKIKETKLVWGTVWEPPLEMAMSMDPPPQVIFFMTDGATGGDVDEDGPHDRRPRRRARRS